MWEYTYTDELFHYGRKGMKWYQNIFTSPKQRKIQKQRKKNLEKARQAKAKKAAAEKKHKEAFEKGRLSARKMTDDELKQRITRLQNEQRHKELIMETRPMRRLMSKAWSDAIVPGITEGGKELIKKTIVGKGSELLGLDGKSKSKSELDVLTEEMNKWKAKESISKSKKNIQLDNDFFENRNQDLADRKNKQKNQSKDGGNTSSGKKNKSRGTQAEDFVKSSNTTAVSTVVSNRSNVNRGKSYVDNSNVFDSKVSYDSDGTMHVSFDLDDN